MTQSRDLKLSFIFNLMFLLVSNVLVKPLYVFGIETKVQNLVGHESYGVYFTFLSLGYLLQVFGDWGMGSFNMSHLHDKHGRQRLVSNGIWAKTILMLGFAVLFFLLSSILGYVVMDVKLLLLVGIIMILTGWLLHLRSILSGTGAYFKDSMCSILDKTISLIILGYLLYLQSDVLIDMYTFAYVQIISLSIAILIAWLFLGSTLRLSQFNWDEVLLLLRRAMPIGITIFLMFAYTKIDAIMINGLLEDGPRANGYYASAYRLFDFLSMFGVLVSGLLLPMISELRDEIAQLKLFLNSTFSLAMTAVIALTAPVIIYRKEIMELLYVDTNPAVITVLGILMMTLIGKMIIFITAAYLTSHNENPWMNKLLLVSVLTSIVLNIIFIPLYGIVGCAAATLVVHWFVALGFSWKFFRLSKASTRFFWQVGILFLLLLGLGTAFYKIMDTHQGPLVQIIILFLISGLITLGFEYKNLGRMIRGEHS